MLDEKVRLNLLIGEDSLEYVQSKMEAVASPDFFSEIFSIAKVKFENSSVLIAKYLT